VFHVLYCLNLVRKAIDPDFYPSDDPARLYRMHRGTSLILLTKYDKLLTHFLHF
jgi:hypothetical protein